MSSPRLLVALTLLAAVSAFQLGSRFTHSITRSAADLVVRQSPSSPSTLSTQRVESDIHRRQQSVFTRTVSSKLYLAKKIDDEIGSINSSKNGKKKKKKGKRQMEVSPDMSSVGGVGGGEIKISDGTEALGGGSDGSDSMETAGELKPIAEIINFGGDTNQASGAADDEEDAENARLPPSMRTGAAEDMSLRGNRDQPLQVNEEIRSVEQAMENTQSIPPDVIFFGDPRKPPPPEAINYLEYHGTLLLWARHAHVLPRSSEERLDSVFPKGRLHPEAPKYRMDPATLSYEKIYNGFVGVMDDIEQAKAFISANIDNVPSKLFLRALTARKLRAQYKNDLKLMEEIKDVRSKYNIAHDQLFFPMNIEIKKAENRVMTYLNREELRGFAQQWDEVETSLHYLVLMSARLIWDQNVADTLETIENKVNKAERYMRDGVRRDLMTRDYQRPAVTAEVYKNSSLTIAQRYPEMYAKVLPVVKLLHEVYPMQTEDEIKTYVANEFTKTHGINAELLKEQLRSLEATVAALDGTDYVVLREYINHIWALCADEAEEDAELMWFQDFQEGGYGFDTYRPDNLPILVEAEQRTRKTGNSFTDFYVQVMKGGTAYSEPFKARPRASEVGDWLFRDPLYSAEGAETFEGIITRTMVDYRMLSEDRKKAEERMNNYIGSIMDSNDRAFTEQTSKIFEFDDSEMMGGDE